MQNFGKEPRSEKIDNTPQGGQIGQPMNLVQGPPIPSMPPFITQRLNQQTIYPNSAVPLTGFANPQHIHPDPRQQPQYLTPSGLAPHPTHHGQQQMIIPPMPGNYIHHQPYLGGPPIVASGGVGVGGPVFMYPPAGGHHPSQQSFMPPNYYYNPSYPPHNSGHQLPYQLAPPQYSGQPQFSDFPPQAAIPQGMVLKGAIYGHPNGIGGQVFVQSHIPSGQLSYYPISQPSLPIIQAKNISPTNSALAPLPLVQKENRPKAEANVLEKRPPIRDQGEIVSLPSREHKAHPVREVTPELPGAKDGKCQEQVLKPQSQQDLKKSSFSHQDASHAQNSSSQHPTSYNPKLDEAKKFDKSSIFQVVASNERPDSQNNCLNQEHLNGNILGSKLYTEEKKQNSIPESEPEIEISAREFLAPGELINGSFYMYGELLLEQILDFPEDMNKCVRLLLSKQQINDDLLTSIPVAVNDVQSTESYLPISNQPFSVTKTKISLLPEIRAYNHYKSGMIIENARKQMRTEIRTTENVINLNNGEGTVTDSMSQSEETESQKDNNLGFLDVNYGDQLENQPKIPNEDTSNDEFFNDLKKRRRPRKFSESIMPLFTTETIISTSRHRQRQRKNDCQHYYLMKEFMKNPNWDKQTIHKLSQIVGLKVSQIYKWNWDQQKKVREGNDLTAIPSTLLVTPNATLAL